MQCLGGRDDQPDHVYANLVLKLKSSECFFFVGVCMSECGVLSQDLSVARIFQMFESIGSG